MLNLLIAIISKSFAEINENYNLANYQERARIISENHYLIPHYRKVAYCPRKKYLVVATALVDEGAADLVEDLPKKLDDLEKMMELLQKDFTNSKTDIVDKLKTVTEQIN